MSIAVGYTNPATDDLRLSLVKKKNLVPKGQAWGGWLGGGGCIKPYCSGCPSARERGGNPSVGTRSPPPLPTTKCSPEAPFGGPLWEWWGLRVPGPAEPAPGLLLKGAGWWEGERRPTGPQPTLHWCLSGLKLLMNPGPLCVRLPQLANTKRPPEKSQNVPNRPRVKGGGPGLGGDGGAPPPLRSWWC